MGHKGPEYEQRYSPTLSWTRHLDGVDGQHHAPAALSPVDPVPIVQEAGWTPEPVWTGAENLAHTGIRSPDRPARSESLYRLSYPGPFGHKGVSILNFLPIPPRETITVFYKICNFYYTHKINAYTSAGIRPVL